MLDWRWLRKRGEHVRRFTRLVECRFNGYRSEHMSDQTHVELNDAVENAVRELSFEELLEVSGGSWKGDSGHLS